MQFRLTYQGLLLATQNDPAPDQRDKRAENKHHIRQVIHSQMKRLWETVPFLRDGPGGPGVLWVSEGKLYPKHDVKTLSAKHSHYGWNFVPLVTEDLTLLCGLDILFLRPDAPGGVLRSGDIDNRLKTLFDALRVPVPGERYIDRTPNDDERPFYCLLEEDKLITKIAVETDLLLDGSGTPKDINNVHLVITVTVRPYEMHTGNLQFG